MDPDRKDHAVGNSSVFTQTDLKWMRSALSLARRAEHEGEVPVGAVIVRDDQLIGEGWNRNIGLHDASAHAEIMALRDAGHHRQNFRLPSCSMYVTLEPCAMCVTAAIHARISHLIFAAPDPRTGALGGAFDLTEAYRHNHQLDAIGGLLETEASEMLRAFFRGKRTKS